MLQSLRDGLGRRKWMAWFALAPIAAIFTFWGGSNSLDFRGASDRDAAKVDGVEIPAEKASRAWSQSQSDFAQQHEEEMPPDERARRQDEILESLVVQELLKQRLAKAKYQVGETRVLEKLKDDPDFKDENGKYNAGIARASLASKGSNEYDYLVNLRQNMVEGQLYNGIVGSNFLTRAEAQRYLNLQNEEREIEYARFDAAQLAGDAPFDDAAIKAYYDKNTDRFMTEESVSLEYAELRVEQLATEIAPSEDDLRKLYQDNQAAYVANERRHARQIFFPVAEEKDDAAAKKLAESVLAEARGGKDFAELAKKYSKDASAANGGDLDYIAHQDFPGPFGDTLFGMKVGEIAGPVKSQYGYHLIKLEDIRGESVKSFEEMRAELDSQYRTARAAEIFSDRQDTISQALETGVTDLDKIAKDNGMTRGSIAQFLRGGGAEPLGSSPDLQHAVFDDSTLNQGKIGGPVGIGNDRLVLVKVTSHHKPEVKPLAQVREAIIQLLTHERGAAAAKAAAEAAVPKLEAGEKLATLAQAAKISVEPARFVGRGDPSIPAALDSAVFDAPRPEGKPVIRTAQLDDGSAAVIVITRTRVADTSANPMMAQQQAIQLAQRSAVGDIAAYLGEAKRKAKIIKNPAVFEQ